MLDKKNFYINGKWVSPKNSKEIKVIDPSTEKSCAVISLGDANDVNAAVNAAKNAFDSWSFTTKEKKIELLEKLYAVYKKRWAGKMRCHHGQTRPLQSLDWTSSPRKSHQE